MKPETSLLAYDLFCGDGGVTTGLQRAGFRVIGYDIVRRPKYPGELVLQDIRTVDGRRLRGADFYWASPPCERFSLAQFGARRRDARGRFTAGSGTTRMERRDVEAGMVLVREAYRVITEAQARYWIIENVKGAYQAISKFLGMNPLNAPANRNNSFWLWGVLPPTIIPRVRKSYTTAGRYNKWARARVPGLVCELIGKAIVDARNKP